ncbi:MAG: zf-HC2 domain-containing protein [Thermodesulfobacteriota bacterium]
MNCREAERLIDTFFDGELDGRSMRDAAMHITRCKRCEAELNGRERLQSLLAATIEREIEDVDLSRIWDAVEPALDAAPHARWTAQGFRLAATTARVRGLVLGRRDDSAADRGDDPSLDPAGWSAGETHAGRVWRWSLAGGTALAASVLLAIALLPGARDGEQDATRLATTGAPAAEVARASAPAQPEPLGPASAPPFALASTGDVRGVRSSSKQVQVESVNFPRSSVAMWSEPTSDTTVIWVEDEELTAAGSR